MLSSQGSRSWCGANAAPGRHARREAAEERAVPLRDREDAGRRRLRMVEEGPRAALGERVHLGARRRRPAEPQALLPDPRLVGRAEVVEVAQARVDPETLA